MKTITPFLLSRPKDESGIFSHLRSFFGQDCVKKAGVRALHMTHVMRDGDGYTDDAPLFVVADKGAHRLATAPELPDGVSVPAKLVRDINTHFTTDFLYISSKGINSLIFPDFCHFQAQNIPAEFQAAHLISKRFEESTWAKAASSTFRFAPKSSAHSLLQLASDIERSKTMMAQFFPQPAADLLEQGCVIASVDAKQLQNAIEA